MLTSKYDTVSGDVVLAAAYITLGSAFTQKYRLKLVLKWQKCIESALLECNIHYKF